MGCVSASHVKNDFPKDGEYVETKRKSSKTRRGTSTCRPTSRRSNSSNSSTSNTSAGRKSSRNPSMNDWLRSQRNWSSMKCAFSKLDLDEASFSSKIYGTFGEPFEAAEGVGCACYKGYKVKTDRPNQDSWITLRVADDFSIYGVFDGHGRMGHNVSNYVKDNLVMTLLEDPRLRTPQKKDALKDAFRGMQERLAAATLAGLFDAERSGTTATVILHDHIENVLTIAHVGDSSAVIGVSDGRHVQDITAHALTRDHKPNLVDEVERIKRAGGDLYFDGHDFRVTIRGSRVLGLNMSRSLGDLSGHTLAGMSAEPEVSEYKLSSEDECLLLCSDGIWTFMPPEMAVDFAHKHMVEADAMVAAKMLAKEGVSQWLQHEELAGGKVDDITSIVVDLRRPGAQKHNDDDVQDLVGKNFSEASTASTAEPLSPDANLKFNVDDSRGFNLGPHAL